MSVIIVGGGMTGATLALAISQLTKGQLPVHLVEAVAPQAKNHPGFDSRAIALAQGTCQQLSRIGIWQAIADCATAINTVHVSASRGVEWRQQPYGQVAVIANVATAAEHNGRAFERFTQHGPLAMLPMSDGRCSLVWCHPQDKAEEVRAWSDERFCTELQKAFGWRLGRITHAGKRAVYPLSLTTASQSVSHRVALVGNAAQTLHPIAGQGFNLGLRDVMSLAESLAMAWDEQKDCGAYSVLSHYQKRRQADKEATIGVTDGLVHLFANRWAPLVAGRNLGLMAMELFIPARDVLAQRTLGWVAR